MSEELNASNAVHKAKSWQMLLFALNNGSTNAYFILTMNYIAYYANGVLSLTLLFATMIVTIMRIFDAVTDPIIGALIDKTQTKFGKFRPFMLGGNIILAVSALLMFFGTRYIPESMMGLRYGLFILFYAIFVIGYTFQTSCTRGGQTCITNDPKQRPMFNIFNTVASFIGMGLIMGVASLWGGRVGFGTVAFFNLVVPMVIIVSMLLAILAVIGIKDKDQPEYFGDGGEPQKYKVRDYIDIIRHNKNLNMLIIAAGGSKLASSIAQNSAISIMLFGIMMGDFNELYLPIYIIGFVGAAPFFLLNLKLSQKHGQKLGMITCNAIAVIMYTGVLSLLVLWQQGDPSTTLSLTNINLYTILFILFYMIGFGAFYSTADMSIPMVADCSDYEVYRSGRYVPGMVGTLLSLADKMVSSLSSTIVGVVVLVVLSMQNLPDVDTAYVDGMKTAVIILFCVVPMLAWIASLIAMKFYTLNGKRMEEIQSINAVRKKAISKGMSRKEAMDTYKNVDQVSSRPDLSLGK
ncbi:MFS transporter [Radiobacillus sp. PE A8.2]|uniref:MFS transporter n=1 Tax=Radiobacillus sp. PE A8.2 TaxID=3380349 RepID=UPI00388D9452